RDWSSDVCSSDLVEIRLRADLLPIDLADHVATLDAGFGGRAAIVHPRHDHAVGGAEVELARHVGRDRADVHAQRRFRSALAVGALGLALFRRLADLDLGALLALLTPDPHLRAVAVLRQADASLEVRLLLALPA